MRLDPTNSHHDARSGVNVMAVSAAEALTLSKRGKVARQMVTPGPDAIQRLAIPAPNAMSDQGCVRSFAGSMPR